MLIAAEHCRYLVIAARLLIGKSEGGQSGSGPGGHHLSRPADVNLSELSVA